VDNSGVYPPVACFGGFIGCGNGFFWGFTSLMLWAGLWVGKVVKRWHGNQIALEERDGSIDPIPEEDNYHNDCDSPDE